MFHGQGKEVAKARHIHLRHRELVLMRRNVAAVNGCAHGTTPYRVPRISRDPTSEGKKAVLLFKIIRDYLILIYFY
jgi:hypothetical protein